jgi:hypothetical protein
MAEVNLFQQFLSRQEPVLNLPDNPGYFWSIGGSKIFENVT